MGDPGDREVKMDEEPKKHRLETDAPPWAIVLMGVLLGLLSITVVIGLIRDTLPAAALATALLTAITALSTGLMARYFRDGGRS